MWNWLQYTGEIKMKIEKLYNCFVKCGKILNEQVIKSSIIELEPHVEQSDQIRSCCTDQI